MKERPPDVVDMLEHVYGLLDLRGATSVLDIGCGDGYDVHQISKRADGTCRFWGIDSSPGASQTASESTGRDGRFSFSVVDASASLPFADTQFDVVFSKNVLECVSDKAALLKEVHRVLRRGGQILIAHYDWDSQVFAARDKPLTRKLVHAFGDWRQDWMADCDAWMGRRLWGLCHGSDLFEGHMHTYVLTNTEFCAPYYGHARVNDFQEMSERGLIAREEFEAFYQDILELSDKGEYFYSITMYIYLGRKRAV
jgi:SAM-dependent methyltransferase